MSKQNKQNYKILSKQAQKHEHVISYVIDDVICLIADSLCDETDITAIKIKELPIEAIKNIDSIYLINKIFQANPKLCENKELKEKWFSNPANKTHLIKFLEHFESSNNDLTKDFENLELYQKSNLMKQNAKLIPFFLKATVSIFHCNPCSCR